MQAELAKEMSSTSSTRGMTHCEICKIVKRDLINS